MKDIMFASDIHGSAYYCRRLLKEYEKSGAEKLVLLGDILYHGPRNDLPKDYAPKEVISLLSPFADSIYCVRGNCEAEVDQMVLPFPCMADYAVLYLNGLCFYATHGHRYNAEDEGRNLPPINDGEILIHGHTHIPVAEKRSIKGKEIYLLNPGSVSIPKGGYVQSYGILSGDLFRIMDFEGNEIKSIRLGRDQKRI